MAAEPVDAVTGAVEELFPGVESVVALVTVAVLLKVPGVDGAVTIKVIVAVDPLFIVPRAQLTAVVPLHVPCEGVAETKVVPVGIVSATTTLVAADGPLFVTVMV